METNRFGYIPIKFTKIGWWTRFGSQVIDCRFPSLNHPNLKSQKCKQINVKRDIKLFSEKCDFHVLSS